MHKDHGFAFYCGLNLALLLVIALSLWLSGNLR